MHPVIDEDTPNLSVLKEFDVTAQRELEMAITVEHEITDAIQLE